jgi:hypothetical protein
MYNVLALGLVDTGSPLDSLLMTKPLLEDFHPSAVFGPGVDIQSVPAGVGNGVVHGGTSKFNFGCHDAPCPTEGVVDCGIDMPCEHDWACDEGESCIGGDAHTYCRTTGSYCDATYVKFVRFVEYYAACQGP